MPQVPLISLDGVTMRIIATATNGVVGIETLFTFKQSGVVVTADYGGGDIVRGFLAGVWSEGRLSFRYVQVTTENMIESGRSTATVCRSAGGRLRLEEHFQWESKPGSGTNLFEEI